MVPIFDFQVGLGWGERVGPTSGLFVVSPAPSTVWQKAPGLSAVLHSDYWVNRSLRVIMGTP